MAKIKRSASVRVALLGAAAFTLAACEDNSVETSVFPDLASCESASYNAESEFTADDCQDMFAKAQALHEETAPRYAEASLCEEEHGGECTLVQSPGASGGGSVFMPLMAGYLLGNMMNGGSSRSYSASPIYKTKTGKYATATGSTILNSNRGTTSLRKASFNTAPSTVKSAPMTRATMAKSGGFGASRTSSGFGGSRGG